MDLAFKKFVLQLFISVIATIIGFFVFLIPQTTALNTQVQDGVVGLAVPLSTSVTDPSQPVVFRIIKPDGSVIFLSTLTDNSGIGSIDLDAFHTTKSGIYRVSSKLESEINFGSENTFELFAGSTYTSRSEARLSEVRVEANGQDQSVLTISLKDEYGNAVKDHQVSVISSRSEDSISPIGTNRSDEEGRVRFGISSTSPGQSILTITDIFSIDPNNPNSYVLFDRPSITFTPTESVIDTSINSITNSLFTDTFSTGGLNLEIEAPNKVEVNTFFDITVLVKTAAGTPARDYRGTILFSSDDLNANLPQEQTGYTFSGREARPAEQTFPKATRFTTEGFKEIVVTDVDRPSIEAKIVIEVVSKQALLPEDTELQILSPTNGTTIGKKDISVIGKTLPNSQVGIFVDDILETKLVSTGDGNFEFSLTNLPEGQIKLQVKLLDSEDVALLESEEITIGIDTAPAEINSISITPEGVVEPDSNISVVLTSEPNLTNVRLNVGNIVQPMQESPPGTYTSNFTAPRPGSYPITVSLIDKNGNQTRLETKREITVGEISLAVINDLKIDNTTKDSFKLSWNTSFTDETPENYTFEAELTNPDKTTQVIQSTSTDEIIEASELEPDSSYMIRIRGIVNGRAGEWSEQLSIRTTKPLAIENLKYSQAGGNNSITWNVTDASEIDKLVISYGLKNDQYIVTRALEPNENNINLPDLIGGVTYKFKIDGMKENQVLISSEELTFTPSGNTVASIDSSILGRGTCTPETVSNLQILENPNGDNSITWDTIPNVDYYEVHIGSKPGDSDIGIYTVRSSPFPVPFIDNDRQFHYFSVKAGCSFKQLKGEELSNSLKVDTGPAVWVLLTLLTGSLIGGFFYVNARI